MKQIFLSIFITLGLCACTTTSQTVLPENQRVLLVFYDGLVGDQPLKQEIEKQHAQIVHTYTNFAAVSVRLPQTASLEKAKKRFLKTKGVLSVQQNNIHALHLK